MMLTTIMQIIYCFGIDLQVYQVMKLVKNVNEKTVIDWFSFCRDICTEKLNNVDVVLGGDVDSNIIEIDESLFGKKRKYHRGTGRQDTWIFGMVERGKRDIILRQVNDRTKDTLIPLIEKHVKKGSTIYSDGWASYTCLQQKGYEHGVVNHSVEFKSADGVCTNTIEGLWGLVKGKIKSMKGIRHHRFGDVLDEFMYRYKFAVKSGDVYHNLLSDIAEFYKI